MRHYQRRDRLFGLLSELGNNFCINLPILGVAIALSDLPIIIRFPFFLLGGIFNELFNELCLYNRIYFWLLVHSLPL